MWHPLIILHSTFSAGKHGMEICVGFSIVEHFGHDSMYFNRIGISPFKSIVDIRVETLFLTIATRWNAIWVMKNAFASDSYGIWMRIHVGIHASNDAHMRYCIEIHQNSTREFTLGSKMHVEIRKNWLRGDRIRDRWYLPMKNESRWQLSIV